jgi:hypothetical protein
MTRQIFQDNNYTFEIEFRFEDNESNIPSSVVNSVRINGGTVVKRKTFTRIILDHDLPESACYLSYHGLPEPEGIKKDNYSWQRILGVLVAIIAIIAVVSWTWFRMKKR